MFSFYYNIYYSSFLPYVNLGRPPHSIGISGNRNFRVNKYCARQLILNLPTNSCISFADCANRLDEFAILSIVSRNSKKKHDQDCKKRLHQGALVLEELVFEGRQIELHF